MSTETASTTEKQKLSLRLPWFHDPRKLNRTALLKAIAEYGINSEELDTEPKSILVAKLYALILDDGKRNPLNPEVMDDQQPEKWYLLAERFHNKLFVNILDGSDRCKAIAETKEILSGFSIDELIEVGNGDSFPLRCRGEISLILACRLISALTLQPLFESEAEKRTGNHGWIRSSVTIAGNYNGHTRIPHHFTLEGAQEENEKKVATTTGKRKVSSI